LHEKAERHRAAIAMLERKIISGDCRDKIVAALQKQRAGLAHVEEKMLRRDEDPAAVNMPAEGWRLIARRQFQVNGQVVPVGAEVPVSALEGRNLAALLSGHFVSWQPPGNKPLAKARVLPAPKPEPPRPAVELIDDPDPVASWRRSLESMTAKCGGNAALAKDLLLANRTAQELYKLACRSWADAEAKKRNTTSVSPSLGGF
jgi:hypothetical protein